MLLEWKIVWFNILSEGGECLKPLTKRAMCCFSLNVVFGVTHQFLQEMGKLNKLLNSKSTLSKAALDSGWRIFLLFVCYFDSVYKYLHSENYLWLEHGIPRHWVVL